MNRTTNILLGIIGAVLAIGLIFQIGGKNTNLGADAVTNPQWFYNGISIGKSNKQINNLTFGTCTLTGLTTLATSTAGKMSCSATGTKSGDIVNVQAPSSMPQSWSLIGATASTTADVIEVLIYNDEGSGTTTIPSTAKAGIMYHTFR